MTIIFRLAVDELLRLSVDGWLPGCRRLDVHVASAVRGHGPPRSAGTGCDDELRELVVPGRAGRRRQR